MASIRIYFRSFNHGSFVHVADLEPYAVTLELIWPEYCSHLPTLIVSMLNAKKLYAESTTDLIL
jgi:hypothetical protein